MLSTSAFPRSGPLRLGAALLLAALPGVAHAAEAGVPRVLGLDRAVDLAVSANPALAAAGLRVRAAEARRRDAGCRPNPSLEASAENWGGALGSDRAETTVELTQPLELGGDRRARVGRAQAGVEAARADRALELREVAAGTAEDFLAAWVAQERSWRLRDSRRLAAEAVDAARERLAAGAAPAVERIRAEGHLALIEAERSRAAAASRAARRALALRWGDAEAQFDSLELPRPTLAPPPAFDSLRARLAGHPERVRAGAEAGIAAAEARMARAGRVPDLGARFGVRDLREAGGAGLVAGISLPLPLWDTRAGAFAAAEAERSAAMLRVSAIERRLESELRSALERLGAAIEAFRQLEERGAPAAEEALASLGSGYRAGRWSYLDLFEGQRAALEARLALVEASAEVWRSRAALERLIGGGAAGSGNGAER